MNIRLFLFDATYRGQLLYRGQKMPCTGLDMDLVWPFAQLPAEGDRLDAAEWAPDITHAEGGRPYLRWPRCLHWTKRGPIAFVEVFT
jgi:hypothetical protein